MLRRFAKRVLRRLQGSTRPVTEAPPPAPPPAAAPPAAAESLTRMEAGAQEVLERVEAGEPVVLLDVREPAETADGTIAGARLIPLGELERRWDEVADCDEIVCYCARGGRSLRAAELLRQKGVFNATSMEGGVAAWTEAGGSLAAPGSDHG